MDICTTPVYGSGKEDFTEFLNFVPVRLNCGSVNIHFPPSSLWGHDVPVWVWSWDLLANKMRANVQTGFRYAFVLWLDVSYLTLA